MPQTWAEVQALLIEWGPLVAGAIVILIASHFIAKAVRWAIVKGVNRLPFVGRKDGETAAKDDAKVADRVGDVGYWLVWLLGLIGALYVLKLDVVVTPLSNMVTEFVTYVPNVVGAALIFLVGFALASIVRRLVEAAVQAVELDKRLVSAGLTHTPRGPDLARLLGVLVFTLIIIPVSIAALETLGIDAISQPAIGMLALILDAIPRVVAAGLVIFIAYLIGRWVGTLAEAGLRSINFDGIVRSLSTVAPIKEGMDKSDLTPGVDTIKLDDGFPPSRLVGVAVLVGIVLFASVEAARLLGFGAMAAMLGEVLQLASRVLFGAIIIAVGVLLANILAAAAGRGDRPSAEIMSVMVRWGVIALAAAVGLRFMGLANDIITIAFGLVLGAVAVAVAIAFGVGGRDAAKRLLDRWTA